MPEFVRRYPHGLRLNISTFLMQNLPTRAVNIFLPLTTQLLTDNF